MEQTLQASCLTAFPEENKAKVDQYLLAELCRDNHKIVVLDDDPTGVQTVHNISVYTDWSVESLECAFAEPQKMFFILTNSRGMTASEAEKAHHEIMQSVSAVSRKTGKPYLVISRSDSTLRGHYPLETQIIREETENDDEFLMDGEILCFFFREGGRYTLNDTHYVRYGDELVPAAQTEFAKDKTFGYSHSDLKEYIEERTCRAYPASGVVSIPLAELRALDVDAVQNRLMAVSSFGKVIVNATDPYDVKVFCIALYRAVQAGRHFCFRSAATLAQIIGGVVEKPLLKHDEMVKQSSQNGGIVVVGSHTQKTTAQLAELVKVPGVVPIEMNSDLVLQDGALVKEAAEIVKRCDVCITQGHTPVVYTCRRLLSVPDDTPEAALLRSVRISDAVQSVVRDLSVTPAFVVAKGGITSSDVGTKALNVKRATVLGQIRPGIPVWQTGMESRFPGVAFVIFPGNVGTESTLREAVEILMNND